MAKKLIKGDYDYKEGWQYQYVEIDPVTLLIYRSENFKKGDTIVDNVELIDEDDKDYLYWFKKCIKNLRKYNEMR
jgi:hypothetical protein